jgi:putative DNA methylase
MALQPYEWKDRPALIEHLFPVQRISAESYKEQMAGSGKTLTGLGSYWKGRKPLILSKACILGTLLPETDDRLCDLEIFEMLMAMDDESLKKRIAATLPLSKLDTVGEYLILPYNERVRQAKRPEELDTQLYGHIWDAVNKYLGTSSYTFPDLVNEIGVARFGRRPKVADVFSGSGQIPFEAARLGCDVYASDLNPIASMLTWGGFHIVGASEEKRKEIDADQDRLSKTVQAEIDTLGTDSDGNGWRAKVFLYCIEVTCPESGWKVPLLPTLIISKGYRVGAVLLPRPVHKRYDIDIQYLDASEDISAYEAGTIQGGDVIHNPDGITTYRVSINSIRGDYKKGKETKNKLRMWEKADFTPRPDDIYQERLYCVQWMRPKPEGRGDEYKFRAVTPEDTLREQKVTDYLASHFTDWQAKGYVPDMLIEAGMKTDEPIRTRGWTHWHHLFNPRHLVTLGLLKKNISDAFMYVALCSILDFSSKLSRWTTSGARLAKDGTGKQIGGASNNTSNVFYNQAFNTLYNWGCRSLSDQIAVLKKAIKWMPLQTNVEVDCGPASTIHGDHDIYITDPPYGDAVKYEEITEFFIAWLRKNPPPEFASWTWDSRRSLAIKGEDEGFRQGMISAYRRMAEKMPDNGIQVLMFTHQSGSIWADMANIVWASGLQVTAAWYVVTETDSALRDGAYVKGTVMLVLRKRNQRLETFRDDLGWEIEVAVKEQVEALVGLDKRVREQRSEGLYSDADLQMAGYAAALKVLTAYSFIDGKDMVTEAEAPRQKGKKTFVDEMIDFAVQTAVQFLVPVGFEKNEWQKLRAVERYYLKMAEIEHQGQKSLDNYQNFAKAFKVRHFEQLMSDASKANSARLKIAAEFKASMMSGDSEISGTPLRALLYAMYEISREVEVEDALLHLMENCPNYLQNKSLMVKMAAYLAQKRDSLKSSKTFAPEVDASASRILAEAIQSQRL